jgi:hypothetical protein
LGHAASLVTIASRCAVTLETGLVAVRERTVRARHRLSPV